MLDATGVAGVGAGGFGRGFGRWLRWGLEEGCGGGEGYCDLEDGFGGCVRSRSQGIRCGRDLEMYIQWNSDGVS